MKNYSLPSQKECFDITKKLNVPPHIVRHNQTVAKLGVFLAQKLKENSIAIDLELVEKACLLHDIARLCDLKESNYNNFGRDASEQQQQTWKRLKTKFKAASHEDIAYELLKEKYPVLALTIKKHRYAALSDEIDRPDTWEEKIVYYADKRVMHDMIVTLKERLEEAHQRSASMRNINEQSKIDTEKIDQLIFKLEQEIFAKIDLDPLEVTEEFIDSHSNT
ncbi:MAG: hypothetical protein A2167_00785 [Planctomycetes bacterium RBG_13_46_10]|nr:MAG: hypothetical protein A2167_00785 [Planctomycetes bacterium RBG_13_46_10]